MSESEYSASKSAARANRAFYRAFERLDLEAMRAVWLDDPSVKCIHPGWHVLVGTERVLDSWRDIFAATSSIRFDLADLDVRIEGELAWATNVERIRVSDAGGERAADAVATNLFVRRDGEWKMILHHASPVARIDPA